MNSGFWAAATAFLIWGIVPIYWKWLDPVPSVQIMAHRLVWCFVLVAGYLAFRRGLSWWRPLVAQPRLLKLLSASAVLIALNWWLYIWAVNDGHIVESSLGYFINPLFNVLLGVVVLGERLNPRQWLAVAVAAAGVAWLTVQAGGPPWIALGLATTFGLYGLIRKVATVESIPALGLEGSILFLPALAFLLLAHADGSGSFGQIGWRFDAMLIASGLITAIPLVLFAYGAQRIPYSLVGVLQYIGPTLQLLIGIFIYQEPFTRAQAIGYGCIWLALAIYAGDGLLRMRARR